MGISGSLKDVSVADVMQFIHLGRRTGTLLLSRASERAMIGFHGGRLVSAQAPQRFDCVDVVLRSRPAERLTRAFEIESGMATKSGWRHGGVFRRLLRSPLGSGRSHPLRDLFRRQGWTPHLHRAADYNAAQGTERSLCLRLAQ